MDDIANEDDDGAGCSSICDEETEIEKEKQEHSSADTGGKSRPWGYCAYCYERVHQSDMTILPFQPARRKIWLEALGERVQNYINEHFSQARICKRHFKPSDLSVGWKVTRVGSMAVPRREAKYEVKPFRTTKYRTKKSERPVQEIGTYCAYCGICKPVSMMKVVSAHKGIREMWCRRLGEEFRETIAEKKAPFICKSHMPQETMLRNGRFPQNALPNKLDDERESIFEGVNRIAGQVACRCAYCYSVDFFDNMVVVPNGVYRKLWTDMLGERFGDNLKFLASPYICRTHFGKLSESCTTVPIPFSDPNIDEKKMRELDDQFLKKNDQKNHLHQCSFCGEMRISDEILRPVMTKFRLNHWSDALGIRFEYNVFMTNTICLCISHFKMHNFVFNCLRQDAVPCKSEAQRKQRQNEEIQQWRTCAYCHRLDKMRFMRRVVECPIKFREWVDILGEGFEKNCRSYQEPAICRNHFKADVNDDYQPCADTIGSLPTPSPTRSLIPVYFLIDQRRKNPYVSPIDDRNVVFQDIAKCYYPDLNAELHDHTYADFRYLSRKIKYWK